MSSIDEEGHSVPYERLVNSDIILRKRGIGAYLGVWVGEGSGPLCWPCEKLSRRGENEAD